MNSADPRLQLEALKEAQIHLLHAIEQLKVTVQTQDLRQKRLEEELAQLRGRVINME